MRPREDGGAEAASGSPEADGVVARARQARDVFDRALEVEDEQARDAFVARACGRDAALEADVRALLKSLRDADTSRLFPALAHAAGSDGAAPAAADRSGPAGRLAGASAVDLEGRTAGNFRLARRLGQGGMGAVYQAQHVVLARPAAVKVLHAHLAGDQPSVRRFLNEARAVNAIRHPHIVEVLDAGMMDEGRGPPYIAMELLEGESLGRRLARVGPGPLPVPTAVRIAKQVAEALAAAHAAGVVHRDLKPENIFLASGRDDVKVLDFGIAKLRGALAVGATTTGGALLGTPQYMAPEQWRDQGLVDERTDVYALGLLLAEMLTGRPTLAASSWAELFERQASGRLPPLPGVPPLLERVVHRALAIRPEDRPPSMRAFADALAEAVDSGAEEARSAGPKGAAERSPRTPGAARRGTLPIAAAAALLLAVGGAVFLRPWLERASGRDKGGAGLAVPPTAAPPTATSATSAPAPPRAPGSELPAADRGAVPAAPVTAARGSTAPGESSPPARVVPTSRRRGPRRSAAGRPGASAAPATTGAAQDAEGVVPSFLRQNPYR